MPDLLEFVRTERVVLDEACARQERAQRLLLAVMALAAIAAVLFSTIAMAQPAALAAPAAPAVDPGVLLGLAAAGGVLIRSVIIPLLKSPIAGAIFKKVPLPAQMMILVVLSALVGLLDKLALGGSLLDVLVAGVTAFSAALATYGFTAPLAEKRPR